MDNENEELVNRSLYKRIKSMNRAEMENFVRNVFNSQPAKPPSFPLSQRKPFLSAHIPYRRILLYT